MAEDPDKTQYEERTEQPGFFDNYLRGLHASAGGNASAYGYSVTITASFGLLSVGAGRPTALEIFTFAGGAVLAFAIVETVATRGFRHRLPDEPSEVRALGGSMSVLSVGTALAAALVAGSFVGGVVAWPVGSFLATLFYLLLFAVELGLAELIRGRRRDRNPSQRRQ